MQLDHIPLFTAKSLLLSWCLCQTEHSWCVRSFIATEPLIRSVSATIWLLISFSLFRISLNPPLLTHHVHATLKKGCENCYLVCVNSVYINSPYTHVMQLSLKLVYPRLVSKRLLMLIFLLLKKRLKAPNMHSVSDTSVLFSTSVWHHVNYPYSKLSKTFVHVIVAREEFDIRMCKVMDDIQTATKKTWYLG